MTQAVPVVYITMPTGEHPKALPAELLYFLGAPHAVRATETTLTYQACQLMTDLGTSLVIVDEVHGIDRSRASHAQQSDQLKYFMDHVPATFVLAGINVENCGFFNGHRGEQLARRFTALKASPSNYSTIPQRQEWALLIEGFERALRLHAHKPGSLLPLADYLYGRTGGCPWAPGSGCRPRPHSGHGYAAPCSASSGSAKPARSTQGSAPPASC